MNMVCIIGRLTADTELKTTNTGKSVVSFSVAVNKDKEHADFFDVVAWNKTAELVNRYFHKGDMIAIEGRLSSRVWEDRNGNKRKSVEIVANNVSFTGGKSTGETPKTSYSAPQSRNGTSITAEQFEAAYSIYEDDSELPF